jgi:UDP-glucose 4-epimerase
MIKGTTDNLDRSFVLVTGGLGFIGSHVVIKLIENGENVIIIDNLLNSKKEVFDKIQYLTKESHENNSTHLKFIKEDIRDKIALINIFSNHKIECVMHFAALKSVSDSEKYPDLYYDINVNGTKMLLDVVKMYGCKNFIYSSSATVYGDSVSPVTENSKIGHGLTCNYAKNKFICEQYIQELNNSSDNKVKFVILRYFNPIGAHQSGLIGEDPVGTPNNIFPYLLRVSIKKNSNTNDLNNEKLYGTIYDKFTIFGNDYDTRDGTCSRDYIHVEDLAYAHIVSMEKLKNDKTNTNLYVYNVGTGKNTTVLELINLFNDVLEHNGKTKICYSIGDRRDGDLKESYACVDKIYNELNFRTKYDVKKMCEDGLRYAKIIN